MTAEDLRLLEGTVTVLSADLVGSTVLNQRLGDAAAAAIEREIESQTVEQVARHRGAVIKHTGDGLMAAFPSARRALGCAQEIQRSLARRGREQPEIAVQMRVGLHTGEVLEETGDLRGETLIIAKRIEEEASPGGILASETVYGVLGTARAELECRGEFELKGISRPWRLFEVPWVQKVTMGGLAPNELTPFVGRTVERARLRERVEAASRSAGSLVLISGEAGVGKSRLAHEVASEARRAGLLTLAGHCLEMESSQPYQPLIEQIEQAAREQSPEALRQALGENAPEVAKLMPELRQRYADIPEPASLPPEQERRYVLHGVSEFVERAARARPLLLLFEDLHWADQATLLLLIHLAPRLHQIPVLVLGTYRQTELEPGRPFGGALEDLLRERLVEDEIELHELPEEGVAALLEGRSGRRPPRELVSLFCAETEGNPFFVEELFRHLHEAGKLFDAAGSWRSAIEIADTEVPRGVRLVIGHRLERVSEDCRRVLTMGAVAGRTFGFELLTRVSTFDEDRLLDALDEAENATLVQDASIGRDARYGFAHEQIRQTLLSTLSFPRRQRMHRRIADALEEIHGGEAEEHAAELAYHLYQAGPAADEERTARYLRLAGQRAMESLAFEEAVRQFDATLSVLPSDDVETRGSVLCECALAFRGAGQIEEALASFARALEIAPEGTPRDAVLYKRACLQIDLFRAREAVEDLETLLAHARSAEDRQREVELMLALGRAYHILSLDNQDYAPTAREWYERSYALAKSLGDRRAMARALIPTNWFADYWPDYMAQARANLEEASALLGGSGDEELAIDCATARLRVLTPIEAAAEAEALRARLEARRDLIRLKEFYFWLMWLHWMRAELERCVETCNAGISLAHQLGSEPVQYPTIKALALTDLGRFDEAWHSLQQEAADDDHPFGRAVQQLGIAVYLDRLGALERAAETAKDALERARLLSRVWMQGWMVSLLASLAARTGDAALRSYAEAVASVTGFRPSRLARAELALADDDPAAALDLLRGAIVAAERSGQRRELLLAREIETGALAKLGRWAEALAAANAGLALAETTGFQALAWRLLAARARAQRASGDAKRAARDEALAGDIVRTLAARIPDSGLRAFFETDPIATQVLASGGGGVE